MDAPTTFDDDTLHKVINYLGAIVGFTDLLAEQEPRTELTARLLSEIRAASAGAAMLLGRPLALDED
jgi:hypothetical protein